MPIWKRLIYDNLDDEMIPSKVLVQYLQVDLRALLGKASATSIADELPFGARCVPIPVFNATRLCLYGNYHKNFPGV